MSTTSTKIRISQLEPYTNNTIDDGKVIIPISVQEGDSKVYLSYNITWEKLSSNIANDISKLQNTDNAYNNRIQTNTDNIKSINRVLGGLNETIIPELRKADATLQKNINDLDTKLTDKNTVLTEAIVKNAADINTINTNRDSLGDITATSLNVGSGDVTCGDISATSIDVGSGDVTCGDISATSIDVNTYPTIAGNPMVKIVPAGMSFIFKPDFIGQILINGADIYISNGIDSRDNWIKITK